MAVTITIEGTESIDRAIKRLSELGSRKRDVTKIFSNNMKPLLQAGKANAPVNKRGTTTSRKYASRVHKAGTLRRSIKFVTSKRYEKVWYVVAKKNPGRNNIDGWYRHFVSRGTVKQRANPFMDRAWNATKVTVLNGLERDLWALGDKLWKG